MHLVLHDGENEQPVACRHCKWNGSSADLIKGELLVVSNISELYCPDCNRYLGFIQHDEKEED